MPKKIYYTLYVDESGDAGIKRVQTAKSGGSSPFMVLGAALVPHTCSSDLVKEIDGLTDLFGKKDLHCSSLNHNQIVRYASDVAKKKFLAFGLISRKDTLKEYKSAIEGDHRQYYNKCLQYLLETVGRASSQLNISHDQINIYIEEGVVRIPQLKKYIKTIQNNPMHKNAQYLINLDCDRISAKSKKEDKLLQIPDLVAHAIYRCVNANVSNYNICEPRYLNELRRRFYKEEQSKKIEGWGIKYVHTLDDLGLTPEIEHFLTTLTAN